MSRIVVLGDLNLDIHARIPELLPPGEEVREPITVRPGGSAGTFARTAARLGADVTFLGAVGNDLVGDLLEASLVKAGVTPVLHRTKSASGAVLAIQKADERSMVCSRGANDDFTEDLVSASALEGADHLHVSGYTLLSKPQRKAAARAFAIAADFGMTCSLDPPPAGLIRTVGVGRFLAWLPPAPPWMFPNLSEGRLLTGIELETDVVDALSALFPCGALTLGARGAAAWMGSSRSTEQSEPVGNVDSTGAGDVYAAVFVCVALTSGDVERANREACRAASDMLRERRTAGA